MNLTDASSWPLSLSATAAHPSELLAGLRAGRPEAIAAAYDLHAAAVLAFARRLLGDEAAAEDLTHEVFVTLPRAIGGFRGDASLRTFLVSVAVNHARHHVRAAQRRRAAMKRFADEGHDSPRTPEHAAQDASLARALVDALDTLPVEQRVAFVLSEVEERPAREIAEITGAPEVTVRTRVFKAKAKLREELAKRGVR